jgi:phospholipid transport system substrate-binding protein
MTNRRILLRVAALAFSGAVSAPAMAAASAGDAAAFVKNIGDHLVSIINAPGEARQKHEQIAAVIESAVDVDGIARFCLGRFWPRATPDQQRDFIQAFRSMLVTNIAQKLGDYRGVRFSVGRSQRRDTGDVVTTTIERPSEQPSHVEWLVTQVGGTPKIEDMVAEGVSMRITQRNDYESFLSKNGGNIVQLIRALQQRAAQTAAN